MTQILIMAATLLGGLAFFLFTAGFIPVFFNNHTYRKSDKGYNSRKYHGTAGKKNPPFYYCLLPFSPFFCQRLHLFVFILLYNIYQNLKKSNKNRLYSFSRLAIDSGKEKMYNKSFNAV
mgnify:CR=1 FL=1